MTKYIYKLILISFILPIQFSQAESIDSNLAKKHKIYELIKDIREELGDAEHSQEQVAKSHKNLNKVLVTLVDEYEDTNEDQASIAISDGPIYSFGPLAPIIDKSHVFVLYKSGPEPITNLTIEPLSRPFQFGTNHIGGKKFPGRTGTCNPDYIVADCTFVVSTRARKKGEFNDSIKLTYTQNGKVYTVTREVTASYR